MGTNMQDIQFLSTLSLRRATIPFVQFLLHTPISIHALLAESDGYIALDTMAMPDISIHALLAESDLPSPCQAGERAHFYPRSPCGERHGAELDIHHNFPISIHALLAESDKRLAKYSKGGRAFLSTLSLRRATDDCPGRPAAA